MANNLTPEQWLAQMPLSAIRTKLESLEEQARKIDADLKMWRDALALRERSPQESGDLDSLRPAAQADLPINGDKPTLREAVIATMRTRQRPWSAAAIRKELVRQGQLQNDQGGKNRLYSMLSDMAKRKQVKRPHP